MEGPGPILKVIDLDEFALGGTNDTVWLYVKDDNGIIASGSVQIVVASDEPVIDSVPSPVVLKREGNYYVGTITFDIESKP